MSHPHIVLNWFGILAATAAAFVFGFLWYGPIFGKKWASLMGINCDQRPEFKVMAKSMVLQLVGLVLMSYVLTHSGQVWRPSVWGLGEDGSSNLYGFFNAFFTWLGFFIPMQLGKVAWEMRPWKLFILNSGHDFLNLLIISMILAYWK